MSSMTIRTKGDWHNQPQFRLCWSIISKADQDVENDLIDQAYEDARLGRISDEERTQRIKAAYDNLPLDLSAPTGTPDGVHTVFHRAGRRTPAEGVSVGVIVKDGHFEPHSTQAAVYEAVCKSYDVSEREFRSSPSPVIDHIYIESFRWHENTHRLEVRTGS